MTRREKELEAQVQRLETALRQIARGKLQEDNEHPLGEYAAQAFRYLGIARAALAPVDLLTDLPIDMPVSKPEAPAEPEEKRCRVPPPGWRCTRSPGHEGPCAAVPAEPEGGSK